MVENMMFDSCMINRYKDKSRGLMGQKADDVDDNCEHTIASFEANQAIYVLVASYPIPKTTTRASIPIPHIQIMTRTRSMHSRHV